MRPRADDGGRTINAKLVLLGIFALLLVVFGVLNTDDAQVNWILGTWETSLIVVILLSGALGFLIGWLVRAKRDDD